MYSDSIDKASVRPKNEAHPGSLGPQHGPERRSTTDHLSDPELVRCIKFPPNTYTNDVVVKWLHETVQFLLQPLPSVLHSPTPRVASPNLPQRHLANSSLPIILPPASPHSQPPPSGRY